LALKKLGDFSMPSYADNAPGERGLLFVVEQPGRIEVLRHGRKLRRSFLDIRRRVSFGGEQGLFSVAFDPGYAHNGRFYVDYANNHGDVEVDEFRRGTSDVRAAKASRRKVLVIHHQQSVRHYGGQLQFDAKGRLYVSVGDGGTPGDPEDDAQNKGNPLGKILRIDPKPRGGYSVPHGNPFVGRPGRDEIFALGLRNPWRFSFDRRTGEMWVGDVGWDSWEEIDRATPAVAKGANFGWHVFEGFVLCGCPNSDGQTPANYVPPVHVYPHGGSGEHGQAIVGGYVVRDRSLGSLRGRYLYTDAYAGSLRALDRSTNESTSLGLDAGNPSSFGEGVRGHIYVADLSGSVSRLVRR
jgi:glucose/arabinose dehydrogenase